jgi:hypothetical protein
MNTSLLLLLYASIGFVEWALALVRTIYIIRHNMVVVPLTTFAETLIGMLVFQHFITTGNWKIALSYSLGSAFGSLIPMICTRKKGSKHG